MRFTKYTRTKPSGVEWLGDVPEHWEIKRLKYTSSINDDTLSDTTPPDFEFDYVEIGSVNSVEGISKIDQVVFEKAPSRARRIVRHGDTIVSTVRTYLRAIASIQNPTSNLIVSTGFAVVRPRGISSNYLGYALRESSFIETIVARSTGVSYPAINASEIGMINIPLPGLTEQHLISVFLDRETTRIDSLVAKKREMIERLKEKRSALISTTVTCGLPPDAAREAGLPMHPKLKPSGVDWIGDVPVHWEERRLGDMFRFYTGGTPSTSEPDFWEGDIPWVSSKEMKSMLIEDTEDHISEDAVSSSATRVLPSGSLLIVNRSGILRHTIPVGITAREMAINQDIRGCVPTNSVDAKFIAYLIVGKQPALLTLWRQQGATVESLEFESIKRTRLVLPMLLEQRAISAFLDSETAILDRLVGKIEGAIERLQEYRTALITAAVTGKIDVRKGDR